MPSIISQHDFGPINENIVILLFGMVCIRMHKITSRHSSLKSALYLIASAFAFSGVISHTEKASSLERDHFRCVKFLLSELPKHAVAEESEKRTSEAINRLTRFRSSYLVGKLYNTKHDDTPANEAVYEADSNADLDIKAAVYRRVEAILADRRTLGQLVFADVELGDNIPRVLAKRRQILKEIENLNAVEPTQESGRGLFIDFFSSLANKAVSLSRGASDELEFERHLSYLGRDAGYWLYRSFDFKASQSAVEKMLQSGQVTQETLKDVLARVTLRSKQKVTDVRVDQLLLWDFLTDQPALVTVVRISDNAPTYTGRSRDELKEELERQREYLEGLTQPDPVTGLKPRPVHSN